MTAPSRFRAWLFAVGPPRRRCLRLLIAPLALFGVSLLLPTLKLQVFGSSTAALDPGWVAAYMTEAVMFEAAGDLAGPLVGRTPSSRSLNLSRDWFFVSGSLANHLFALACLAVVFRRVRLAHLLSIAAAAFAVTCLLPSQVIDWISDGGWDLGPGYFAWCAAMAWLAVSTRSGRAAPAAEPDSPR